MRWVVIAFYSPIFYDDNNNNDIDDNDDDDDVDVREIVLAAMSRQFCIFPLSILSCAVEM